MYVIHYKYPNNYYDQPLILELRISLQRAKALFLMVSVLEVSTVRIYSVTECKISRENPPPPEVCRLHIHIYNQVANVQSNPTLIIFVRSRAYLLIVLPPSLPPREISRKNPDWTILNVWIWICGCWEINILVSVAAHECMDDISICGRMCAFAIFSSA